MVHSLWAKHSLHLLHVVHSPLFSVVHCLHLLIVVDRAFHLLLRLSSSLEHIAPNPARWCQKWAGLIHYQRQMGAMCYPDGVGRFDYQQEVGFM